MPRVLYEISDPEQMLSELDPQSKIVSTTWGLEPHLLYWVAGMVRRLCQNVLSGPRLAANSLRCQLRSFGHLCKDHSGVLRSRTAMWVPALNEICRSQGEILLPTKANSAL